jgi:hypothetical protein
MKIEKLIIQKVKSGAYEGFFTVDAIKKNGYQQTIEIEPSLEKILEILQRKFDENQYMFN